MDGKDFWKLVHTDERLEWLGCREAGDPDPLESEGHFLAEGLVYIKGPGGYFAIPLSAIQQERWLDILGVLLGVRRAKVLRQLTRITGYYSSTDSWNKSKLAELADRRKAYPRMVEGMEQRACDE